MVRSKDGLEIEGNWIDFETINLVLPAIPLNHPLFCRRIVARIL